MFYSDIKKWGIVVVILVCAIVLSFRSYSQEKDQLGIMYMASSIMEEKLEYLYYNLDDQSIVPVQIDGEIYSLKSSDNGKYLVALDGLDGSIYLYGMGEERLEGDLTSIPGEMMGYVVGNDGLVYLILERRVDKVFQRDIFCLDLTTDQEPVQLTTDGDDKFSIGLDDQGSKLAYVVRKEEVNQLLVLDLGAQTTEVVYETDGELMLNQWIDNLLLINYDQGVGIFDLEEKTIKNIGNFYDPKLAPDLSKVLYWYSTDDGDDMDLYVKDLKTGRVRQITDTPLIDEYQPCWVFGDLNQFSF